MTHARRRSKLLVPAFGLLTLVFLVLAVFAFSLLQEQAQHLRQRTYDETGMAVVHIRLHYEKLMGDLAVVEGQPGAAVIDDAVLEFDILIERVAALPSRPSYDRLLTDETLAIQRKVLASLNSMMPRIDRAAAGEARALMGMRAELGGLRADIERLANQPVQIASERRAALTENFERAATGFGWIVVGLVVSGLAFTAIIWRQFFLAEKREADLKELADNLEQARDAAEAASRAKTEFLSHMSHELRTPMNAILGFAQLLELGVLDDKQKMAVTQILNSGNLLMHLIDQVLELNKITTNQVTLNWEVVAAESVITQSVALMERQAQERRVTISVVSPEGAGDSLRTDRYRLKQVLLNLMSNAIKYNHQGGVVTVSAAPCAAGHIRFTVADDGDGIPLERQGEIFQPFNRLGRENQNIEGTGIGLTITRDLVKKLGGTLDFESAPGQGSTFWFDLPCDATAAPDAEERETEDA